MTHQCWLPAPGQKHSVRYSSQAGLSRTRYAQPIHGSLCNRQLQITKMIFGRSKKSSGHQDYYGQLQKLPKPFLWVVDTMCSLVCWGRGRYQAYMDSLEAGRKLLHWKPGRGINVSSVYHMISEWPAHVHCGGFQIKLRATHCGGGGGGSCTPPAPLIGAPAPPCPPTL